MHGPGFLFACDEGPFDPLRDCSIGSNNSLRPGAFFNSDPASRFAAQQTRRTQ
jgi:hypothetical protein